MAAKPTFNKSQAAPSKPLIPEVPGDGFPAEKDVSTPPPGSDQSKEGKAAKKK